MTRYALLAVALLCACYSYPPAPEVRYMDTQIGKAVVVGGPIRAPQVLARVNPAPTNTAGVVQARVVIAADGTVKNVEILSATDGAAAQSAKDALSQWKFAPTFVEGHAMPAVYDLKLTFKQP